MGCFPTRYEIDSWRQYWYEASRTFCAVGLEPRISGVFQTGTIRYPLCPQDLGQRPPQCPHLMGQKSMVVVVSLKKQSMIPGIHIYFSDSQSPEPSSSI